MVSLLRRKFRKLLVVKRVKVEDITLEDIRKVKCDHGSILNVATGNLVHGRVISCGCLNHSVAEGEYDGKR